MPKNNERAYEENNSNQVEQYGQEEQKQIVENLQIKLKQLEQTNKQLQEYIKAKGLIAELHSYLQGAIEVEPQPVTEKQIFLNKGAIAFIEDLREDKEYYSTLMLNLVCIITDLIEAEVPRMKNDDLETIKKREGYYDVLHATTRLVDMLNSLSASK